MHTVYNLPVYLSIHADLHLSLRLCNEVSEDGIASISHKGAGLEDVHTTDCGCLTELLVAGAKTLHDCTQEATLERERRGKKKGGERGGEEGGKGGGREGRAERRR